VNRSLGDDKAYTGLLTRYFIGSVEILAVQKTILMGTPRRTNKFVISQKLESLQRCIT